MLTEAKKDEVRSLAQRLIRTPSLTSQEGEAAAVVVEAMRSFGYHAVHVDEWGNVVGVVRGTGKGSVLFDAHLDTVPWNRDAWTRDPLGADVAEGRIWGRGASDMKAAAAAAIWAVGRLAHRGGDFGTVYVSCSVCEEPAEGSMLMQICQRFRPAVVVIQEASKLDVNIGQRGRAELIVETIGKPAHSSRPDLGHNAVKEMARLISAVEGLSLPHDDLLGPAILEVTDVKSSPYPGLSVVPYRCRATFDQRLLMGDTPEGIVSQVDHLAGRLGVAVEVRLSESDIATYTGRTFHHRAFAPAWKTAIDSPLVKGALSALTAIGQSPRLSKYSFCTNGSGSAGQLGIPTIGYGPGRESEAHITDEYLELDQLYRAAEGYLALAETLSRLEG